jgi:hypothetical protein
VLLIIVEDSILKLVLLKIVDEDTEKFSEYVDAIEEFEYVDVVEDLIRKFCLT